MGKYTKMSQQVLEKVGGLSNITFVERCATRLRIHYASKSKVDVEAIKGIENVVGVVAKTGQVQIIIGPEVNDAFNDFLEVSGWRPTDDRPTVIEEEPKRRAYVLGQQVRQFQRGCLYADRPGPDHRRPDPCYQEPDGQLPWHGR